MSVRTLFAWLAVAAIAASPSAELDADRQSSTSCSCAYVANKLAAEATSD